MKVYFDNAATTSLDPQVLEVMIDVMRKHYGNPSSIHAHGREVRTIVEQARKTVAKLLNCTPSEIFFTSGGTEADNTAIRCGMLDMGISHAVTSKIEHHAVLHTLENLASKGLIHLDFVEIDNQGNVNLDHLEQLLQTNPRTFVSLMEANNELGTKLSLNTVGDLCEKYNAIFHSDTVQTIGHFRHDFSKLKVHFMVCAAHKLHGPKGIGFLYIKNTVKIKPFIFGGSQERNMRGGTENVYGIAGLAKALEISYELIEEHQKYILELKNYMMEELKKAIPDIHFNGNTNSQNSLYTVLNVCFPPMEMNDMLLFNLDIAGISASGGSACSSGSNVGSHVLSAINASPDRPSIRFSLSKLNTKEEIDFMVNKVQELFPVRV